MLTSDEFEERVELPMVCTCSPDGAEAAAQLRSNVLKAMSHGSPALRAREVTDRTFLSDVCLSLHADYLANMAGIFMDQWYLIVVEQLLPSGGERRISVQADAAEDGLAAAWQWLSEHRSATVVAGVGRAACTVGGLNRRQ